MITRRILKITLLFGVLFLNQISESISKPTQNSKEINNVSDNEIRVDDSDVIEITDDDNEYRQQYAKMMLTYMNHSVDPCEDFYEYSCGNWKNVIDEKQAQHKRSNLLDIIYKLTDSLEKLLKLDNVTTEFPEEWKLTQQFYELCLKADLYPMKKSQHYLDVINEIGGFPAVNSSWKAEHFNWFNTSAHLTNFGVVGLINEQILPQYPFNPYFKMPELGFDIYVHSDNITPNTTRGYMLNVERMREYLTTYEVEESRISKIIGDIFDFWRAVFVITDQFDDDLYKCEELEKEGEFDQWKNFFEISWMGKDFEVVEDDCPCDYFYIELDKVCNEHKEAVANYLALKFLHDMDAHLKDNKFQKDFCLLNIQSSLTYLIDRIYMQEYFHEEIRDEVTVIVNEVRKSLHDMLGAADWLDEATRKEAFLKESTIVTRIGNAENNELRTRLIREMRNLTFAENNYEQNNVNLKKFQIFQRRYLGLHQEQCNKSSKPLDLLIGMQVNAFYYNVDNSINVMAGALHPPAYHKSWPNSLKFGTIGYLVGHEFTHGFDSVGSNYDSTGGARYWWSKKSGKVFDERTDCYVDHYSSYLVPEINRNINGNTTKDENIADSGGLREALFAYRRYMKQLNKNSNEISNLDNEKMPGLNLSPEQLFFLGFAQLWCASYKEEHFWEELTNEHTMDKYRVLGALTNIDEFAKVYECSVGSKMNPTADKCRLW